MTLSSKAQAIIDRARLQIPSMDNPRLADLPFDDFRPHQPPAIEAILQAFKDVNVVVLDAPTGSGKTLIAEAVRRMMAARALYVCNTISLQQQFIGDYKYAKLLMGRSNYTPELIGEGEWKTATCADCSKPTCPLCSSERTCPYSCAKMEAVGSPLTVLNTQYLLNEGNRQGLFRGRELMVMDEADTLEKELMRYAGVEISKRRCEQYGLREPEKVTVSSSWPTWFDCTIKNLRQHRLRISGQTLRSQRERNYLERLLDQLRWIRPQIEEGWVYTGGNGYISFKPVTVEDVGKKLLWPLGRKWLLMSATPISGEMMVRELGWEENFEVVRVPHTFPVENRRVSIRPVANMSRKANERQQLIAGIRKIISTSNERTLIHTVSYDLAVHISEALEGSGRPVLTYRTSGDKDRVLKSARLHPDGIIVAPSFDRGIDLPDDLCRIVIVAKIPFPYLGDRQVSKRMHGPNGQQWYSVQTVRTLVQMCGRGVRHKDDWCKTYILDSAFADLYRKNKRLFPNWFIESIDWSGNA